MVAESVVDYRLVSLSIMGIGKAGLSGKFGFVVMGDWLVFTMDIGKLCLSEIWIPGNWGINDFFQVRALLKKSFLGKVKN